MKIFETFEPVPSRVFGLVDLLLTAGGRRGMSQDEAVALMQPPSLRDDPRPSPIAPNTVAAAVEAELLERWEEPDGTRVIALTEDARRALGGRAARDRAALAEALPSVMARLLLRPQVGGKENRFATLCAWLLAQPATWVSAGHGDFQKRLAAQGFDLGHYGMTNSSSIDNVLYWAHYLGLIWKAREAGALAVVPDPTAFLLRHLDEVMGEGEAVDAHEFRRKVGKACPVLDGGEVRAAVLEVMSRHGAPPWPEDRVSDALSLGLRGLADAGAVRHSYDNDLRVFLTLSRGERVKTIERVKAVRRKLE